MADRKLVVEVIGDASSLTKSFNQATASTKNFQRELNRSTGTRARPLDPLLEDVRRLKGEAADLQKSLGRIGPSAAPGIGQLAGKLGLIGLAASVGFNAIQHLRDGLKATGDEAFTATGRIKNLSAALLQGDIIGAFQALATQETRIAPDLEKAVAALRQMREEASRISLEDVLGQTDKLDTKINEAVADLRSIGVPIDEAKGKTAEWRRELELAALTTLDIGKAFDAITSALPNLLSQLKKFTADAAAAAEQKQGQKLSGLSQLPAGIAAAISREQGQEGSTQGLVKVLNQAQRALTDRIEKLRKLGSDPKVSQALKQAQDQRNAIDAQLAGVLAPPLPKTKAAASSAGKVFDKAADAARDQRDAFERLLGFLDIRLDRAAATKGFQDDLNVLAEQEKAVLAQIKVEGRTVDLERRLVGIEKERGDIARQRKDIAAKSKQSSQFKALGLTGTGEDLTPTIANLQKQLRSITERVAGTALDTPKTKNLLARIRKVLSDPLSKATEETRAKVKELFDALRGEFDTQSKGPLTKTSGLNTKKIVEGLGLDTATENEIRSRLSGFNTAGQALAPQGRTSTTGGGRIGTGGPIIVESHTVINLDGTQIAKAVTKNQQKTRRRNPPQKRGPNRVGGV